MSAGCVRKSTNPSPSLCCIRCAASDTALRRTRDTPFLGKSMEARHASDRRLDSVIGGRTVRDRSHGGKHHAQASAAAAAEQSYMITLAREEGLAALVATLNRRERLHGGAGFRYALTDARGYAIAGASDFEGTKNQGQGWKVVVSQDRGKQKVWHVLVGALPTGQSLYIAQDS